METKKIQVVVVYSQGMYSLKDSEGDFLQSGGIPGIRMAFGGNKNAIRVAFKPTIVAMAERYGLEIVETFESAESSSNTWRALIQRLVFSWWPILLLVGAILVTCYFNSEVELPSLLRGGAVFISMALVCIGIFFGLMELFVGENGVLDCG